MAGSLRPFQPTRRGGIGSRPEPLDFPIVDQMAELFPFRFFDPIRKRWVPARYKAMREDIAARYEKWEITGPGWTPSPVGGSFVPFVKPEPPRLWVVNPPTKSCDLCACSTRIPRRP